MQEPGFPEFVEQALPELRGRSRESLTGAVPETSVDAQLPLGVEPWQVDALATLSPKQRTAVVLKYVDDLDAAGIAEVLRCSVGTARSHLSRGLQRMRAAVPEGEHHD